MNGPDAAAGPKQSAPGNCAVQRLVFKNGEYVRAPAPPGEVKEKGFSAACASLVKRAIDEEDAGAAVKFMDFLGNLAGDASTPATVVEAIDPQLARESATSPEKMSSLLETILEMHPDFGKESVRVCVVQLDDSGTGGPVELHHAAPAEICSPMGAAKAPRAHQSEAHRPGAAPVPAPLAPAPLAPAAAEKERFMRRRMTREERDFIWRHSGERCYICRTPLARLADWHIEHVVAFSTNPKKTDVLGNMLAACSTCNLKKGARGLSECVPLFGDNLDSRAALASHLNSEARNTLLSALKLKREIFNGHMPPPAVLDELEHRLELDVKNAEAWWDVDAINDSIPADEVAFDQDKEPHASGSFGVVYPGTWTRKRDGRQ
ncbi:hypothetical protein T484DRAFT_1774450, partial [Baffinella frigidus]